MMKNKEIVKNIRKIWREELKDCKLLMFIVGMVRWIFVELM